MVSTSRNTYDALEYIGDLGGFYSSLLLIGEYLVGPSISIVYAISMSVDFVWLKLDLDP